MAFPNFNSFVSALIISITSCNSISHCRTFHGKVVKAIDYRVGFIGDQLVSTYLKLRFDEDADKLFDEMPNKDSPSWNSLIAGYSKQGCLSKCFDIFSRMKFESDIQPNEVTFISLISGCTIVGALKEGLCIHGNVLKQGMFGEVKIENAFINFYGKSTRLVSAFRVFDEMVDPNLVSWNSMIAIYTQNGSPDEAFGYFSMMRKNGVEFDQVTILSLLRASENIGLTKLAETIHGLITKSGFDDNVAVATGVLDLYAKLGKLGDSRKVFGSIGLPDRVAWTAMLAGYAVHGHGRAAVDHFEVMVKKGVDPDHVTFTHLLSACGHSGLVREGKLYFEIMYDVYGVDRRLDHYSCMVDLMGRSGRLKDAYEVIKAMPMEPNSGVWGALLGACRVYGDIELGKTVAERLFVLDPLDSRNYIMLSNIYSSAGLWKDASKWRVLMKERGLVRNPGCSYIEHGNKVHRFLAGDRSHPDSEKIYGKLEDVIRKIRDIGFVSKTEFVLHDVDEEVKVDMVNEHSEKLAIAFGLLVSPVGVTLVITKNVRICGDCHETSKFVSLVEKRTIVIRDSKRFHHFSNGLCSCGDYW